MKTTCFTIIFLLLTTNTFAQLGTDKINEIVEQQVKDNYFNGTVLVADQGNIVYHKAFGLADRAQQTSMETGTRFSIASITKTFTAIIILQLVEEGKLALTDNLNKLLPALNIPNADNITVHHLLLHISGLPTEQDIIYLKPTSPQLFVKKTMKRKRRTAEIETFNYNNTDFVLLGLVIEKLTGNAWQTEMSNRIIKPLQMSNTGFLAQKKYPSSFALPYEVNKKGRFKASRAVAYENFYAAGCMYSNAADLLRLDEALYGDKLLNEDSKQKLTISHPEYGYVGYSVWNYNYPFLDNQPLVMERRGGILGSNVVLVRLTDLNRTIIILSNNNRFDTDSFGDTDNLKEAILMHIGK